MVVDTNVVSADLLRTTRPLVDLYRPLLAGRRFLISFQTLAELEFGFRRRDWGRARLRRAREHIRQAEVVWPGPSLLAAYVELRVACDAPDTRSHSRTTMPIVGSLRLPTI